MYPSTHSYEAYSQAADKFEEACKSAKRHYLNKFATDLNSSFKKWWSFMKHTIGKHRSSSIPPLLDTDTDLLVSEPLDKAELLNHYFAKVCTPSQNNPTFPMLAPPCGVMSQFHIYDTEVFELLSSLDTAKSCSPGITNRMLLEAAPSITSILATLFA
ncbi:unnamed protein product [Didymodactylos carnosus]|uniref:Uncharacterized protein n=1 Tax=Didymodactylos carnosus TaxID=1234261 RepID=A0A814UPN9_9BILA|nr:unnamed protein product [Didymodactylos carnosus]CAF1178443.1 unnamed protein product [Didymodactylos carnosus]CAF3941153.1 unnamed protein product [Didymodactylos carnosus]CAF3942643.1 unnamed protein product [Didymodactylos carnosus]